VGRDQLILVSVPSVTVRGIDDRAERAMAGRVAGLEVVGPWSLETSRRFWEGFTPAALAGDPAGLGLRTVFCAEGDWRRAEAEVTQAGDTARVVLAGAGDLDAAAAQHPAPPVPDARCGASAANPGRRLRRVMSVGPGRP